MSPNVINVPTRASLAIETMGLLFLWLAHLNNKSNVCKQISSLSYSKPVNITLSQFLKYAKLIYLSFSSNATIESTEWNDLLLGHNIFEVSVCLPDMHSLDSCSCFMGIFKVHTEVGASCLARFGCILGIGRVSSHSCVIQPIKETFCHSDFFQSTQKLINVKQCRRIRAIREYLSTQKHYYLTLSPPSHDM